MVTISNPSWSFTREMANPEAGTEPKHRWTTLTTFIICVFGLTYFFDEVVPGGIGYYIQLIAFTTIFLLTANWITAARLWRALQSFTVVSAIEIAGTLTAFFVGSYYLGLFAPGSGLYGVSAIAIVENPATYLFLISGLIICPITEEVAFRGYIVSLMKTWSDRRSWAFLVLVVSASVIALDHVYEHRFEQTAQIGASLIQILSNGLVFALCYYVTNNLMIPILAHGFNNAFAYYDPSATLGAVLIGGVLVLIVLLHEHLENTDMLKRNLRGLRRNSITKV